MKHDERFDELLGRLLDETLDAEGLDELAALVAEDSERLAELRRQLMMADQLGQYEDEQRSAEHFVKGLEMRLAATEGSEAFVAQVMENVREETAEDEPVNVIEPDLPWLGSGRFWAIAASLIVLLCVGVGLKVNYVSNLRAQPGQAFLYAPESLAPGNPAAFRVFVRDDGNQNQPLAGAAVEVALEDAEGEEVWLVNATTDENGVAQVEQAIPDALAEGEYQVVAKLAGDEQSTVKRGVKLVRSFRVMVTADKPMYQPGQVMHLRSLSLANADMRPVAGRKTVLEVADAKGNKVFKKVGKTSDFGIFAADFALADQVNTGSYTITATVGDTTSERTVRVERYRLPKYKVDVKLDKGFFAPGDKVSGSVSAQYTFGKPVAGGQLKLTASEFIAEWKPFEVIEGELNDQGMFEFEFRLKDNFAGTARNRGDASVSLEAEVTDKADHVQKKGRDLIVTTEPIRIEVFPESGTLVQNVENVVYVLTTYPDGRPAKTTVTLGRNRQQVKASAAGIAKVKLTPDRPQMQLRLTAEDAAGVKATVQRRLHIDRRADAFLLRTDRAVYGGGDTVKLSVLSPAKQERIFVDVVKDRRAVLMKTLDVADGEGELVLDLSPDLFGTLELRGYRIQPDGNIIGDTKVIQVRRADALKIEAKLDQETYRPAEKALLKFIVTRGNGEGVPAALGLAGVDEAVYALSEMRPGLERVYFAVQEEILKPRYQLNAQPPVQVRQLIEPQPEPGPLPEPDVEEATVVLFAAAEGTEAPRADAGPAIQEKREIVQKEKRSFFLGLGKAGVLTPVVLFALLLVPLLGYAGLKIFRRQPVVGDEAALEQARSATSHLLPWWIVGCVLPVLAVAGAVLVARFARNEGAAYMFLGFALFVVVTAAGLQGYAVWRARKCEVLSAMPLLRKVLVPLPLAYLLGIGAIVALVIGGETRPRLVEPSTALALVAGLLGVLAVVGGVLAIVRHAAIEKLSAARVAWLGFSRTALAGLPIIGMGFLLAAGVFADTDLDVRVNATADEAGGMDNMAMMEEAELPQDAMFDQAVNEPGFTAQGLEKTKAALVSGAGPLKTETTSVGLKGDGALKEPTRVRRYFPETLLWQPQLITDENGHAQLEVPLADSITTWRVAMNVVSKRGELGSATAGIRVFQDFFVDIDFPVVLTQHDEVSVPVAVFNYLDQPQTVKLEVQPGDWYRLHDERSKTLQIGAGEVTRVYFRLEAIQPGSHALQLKAFGSKLADAVERRVRVEPDGKRHEVVVNGRLTGKLEREVVIPKGAIAGANDLFVKIYPGAFSQVVEGLDGIFRMPHGCFEQTSSTTYPNVLVLDYLIRNKMAKPEVELKARNFINLGYQRLLSFEVQGGGFEWFGKAPAHNVLTAYGLMEFSDMSKVHEVDPAVIQRTRNWLLNRQGGDGAWQPDPGGIAEGAINAMQGAKLRTTAYLAWALAETGQADVRLNRALDYLVANAAAEADNYTLGLCANALVAAQRPEAKDFLKRLVAVKTEKDKLVHWTSGGQGATFSRGNTLAIETTAVIAQALLKARAHTNAAHGALAWLIEQKDSRGTWHSTQATVHAMRALLAGTEAGGGAEQDLAIAVIANGKEARQVKITPETSDVYRLISLRQLVQPGRNTVSLEPTAKANLAYQIVAVHYQSWSGEPVPPEEPLTIEVTYDRHTLTAGDTLGVDVALQYNRPGTANMTLVDLGIPPGFAVMPEFFTALKEKGVIEKFTTTGRQVTLYFRELKSGQPVEFAYQLRAKFPVKAKTPRSVAYQYYEPELRAEVSPVQIVVE